MKYRRLGKTEEKVSVLGYGCMRLPMSKDEEGKIDEELAIAQIRYAIDNGVNYIDTAWPYHGGESEPLVGRALKDGYREKVFLATKLPVWEVKKREDMDTILDKQLEKLQTDHIDFYLVHALNKGSWAEMEKLGIIEFLESAKKDGKIRHIGFSFHDEYETFEKIVDSYDWEFCQIQYNYMDENYQAGLKGLNYAAARDMGIIIMEPLRGGNLTNNIPDEIKEIWDNSKIKRKPADWSFQFIYDNPKVGTVLSGMNDFEHIKENIKSADKSDPNSLTEEEKEIIKKVNKYYNDRIQVRCTQCNYCMPCPYGVDIPTCFKNYNTAYMFNNVEAAKGEYNNVKGKASKCVECGLCEESCPQNIEIRKELKNVKKLFEDYS